MFKLMGKEINAFLGAQTILKYFPRDLADSSRADVQISELLMCKTLVIILSIS